MLPCTIANRWSTIKTIVPHLSTATRRAQQRQSPERSQKGWPGHQEQTITGGGAGQKWWSLNNSTTQNDVECPKQRRRSLHNLTTNNDAECHKQRAANIRKGDAHAVDIVGTQNWQYLGGDLRLIVSFERQYNGHAGRQRSDRTVPGRRAHSSIENILLNYKLLDNPKKITAAGHRVILGTATGVLSSTITDENGEIHNATFRIVTVPGLGLYFQRNRHQPQPGTSSSDKGRHLRAATAIACRQWVMHIRHKSQRTNIICTQHGHEREASADIWHRRPGHTNPCNMELLLKKEGKGVNFNGIFARV